jgi:hypothetical protein
MQMKYEPGEIIRDKYVIIKLIGSGSFGTIYQGMSHYQNFFQNLFQTILQNFIQISLYHLKIYIHDSKY